MQLFALRAHDHHTARYTDLLFSSLFTVFQVFELGPILWDADIDGELVWIRICTCRLECIDRIAAVLRVFRWVKFFLFLRLLAARWGRGCFGCLSRFLFRLQFSLVSL